MWLSSGPKSKTKTTKYRGSSSKLTARFKADDVHGSGRWGHLSLRLVDARCSNSGSKSSARHRRAQIALDVLNQARYGISWGALGAAMSCYDTALQYSLLRKQFRDQPIASHQLCGKTRVDDQRDHQGPVLALQVAD